MKRETRRYGIAFAVLLVLLGGLLIWNLNAGSFPMTASQVLAILFGQGGDETASRIVWDIRLPRILGAALLGGALSISGFLLQTFFANPIASPFVLGISSGAKLTVALTMIFLLQRGILSNSFVLIGSAFVGAMLSMVYSLPMALTMLQVAAGEALAVYALGFALLAALKKVDLSRYHL